MARIDKALTAQENVLALINEANPGLNLTLSQVTFGTPEAVVGNDGRNTAITLTGVPGQGIQSTQTFHYTRLALAAGAAWAVERASEVLVAEGDTTDDIRAKIATVLDIPPGSFTTSDIVLPLNPSNPGHLTIAPAMAAASLLFTGSHTVVLTSANTDEVFNQVAPESDLTGFEPGV